MKTRKHNKTNIVLISWVKFIIGAAGIAALALFFGSGYAPPGVCGEVIRNNQAHHIDASPFFYNDVENFTEIVEAAEQLRGEARLQRVIQSNADDN